METLAQLEVLCERLYNSHDSVERAQAESTLKCFGDNSEYILQCQFVLGNSSNQYALMMASSSLLKQLSERRLSLQLRIEIRNYVVNYLATRGPELDKVVTGYLIQLLCRLTKFGWFDDDRFREIVNEALNFLSQASSAHYAIGLKILDQLIGEMNQSNAGISMVLHRKISISFKDLSLLQIFQISLTSLHQLKSDGSMQVPVDLRKLALSLSLKCLSYDFVGSSVDESSDEFGAVQIPSSWKALLQDPSTVQIFFDYYKSTESDYVDEAHKALECLVRLVSVRRSIFVEDAPRSQYLTHLMAGSKEILQTGQGLAKHHNYHEFCRLLGRFKVNFQLSELVSVDIYSEWIKLVAEFTLKSLQSWQWASSSIYYLLGLWSRLVTSVPYLKGDAPSLLDETVPKIAEGFVTSRLSSVQAGLSDELVEDPLDNAEQLQDQLESFPYLFRFQYQSSSLLFISIMEPLLQVYTERTRVPTSAEAKELCIIEGQIAWLVHIVAAVIKIRQSYTGCSPESQELIDAELAARVLQLINIMDTGSLSQRYQEISKQRLDRAVLIFLQNFRRSYVGDQSMQSSKQLYARLSELLGLPDHLVLLNVIVGKIATNLKFYTECEEVIKHTLTLFLELSSGYMTGKLLLKLESVKFIIEHHSREYFPFLEEYRCSPNRTNFYFILGSLIYMEESPVKFKTFIVPISQVMTSLETTVDAAFRTESVKYAIVGLMRDLRGLAMATNSKKTYGLLFDWFYPSRMPLLLKSISSWTDDPEVTTPILKFMAEFVQNKGQRVTFDSSSPNGILLFREVSKLLMAYGSRILSLPSGSDIYKSRYKGIWICLLILSRALSGNYVNFGVFELYGDRALADALDISLKMALSVPLSDIAAYLKLSRAYFGYMEILFTNHLSVLLNLDTSTFLHITSSLKSGLKSLDASVSTQCAIAIDNLATFYFNNVAMADGPPSVAALNLVRHISEYPNLFLEMLITLFEMTLFEDSGNQWSLSKPMLSLILISEQMFNDLRAHILASQPADQHQLQSACFDKLMADITRSLESKNREKFTQNLTAFKAQFRAK